MPALDSSKTRMARLPSKWRFSGMLAGRRTSSSLGCRVVGRGPKEGAHALSRRPGNEWHLPCRRQNNKSFQESRTAFEVNNLLKAHGNGTDRFSRSTILAISIKKTSRTTRKKKLGNPQGPRSPVPRVLGFSPPPTARISSTLVAWLRM
jgi:hypothetical protein